MLQSVRHDDPRVAVARTALAPYAWRTFSTEMLARRLVAVLDRHWLDQELTRLSGALDAAGGGGEIEPAGRDDERVGAVTLAFMNSRWRGLTLDAVCRLGLAALDRWEHERAWQDLTARIG